MKWVTDEKGNRCSVERWGSEEKAKAALDSLECCSDCSDCSGCSDCSNCSGCLDCSGCSDCWSCSGCSGCWCCSGCWSCLDCSRCSRCSGCSDCSNCSGCSGYSDVSRQKNKGGDGKPTIPKIESIHQKVYEAASRKGALNMDKWHSCETTHCRAGLVVTLAGKAGKELEAFHNTLMAALLIYRESGYRINLARFFDSNSDALEDMRKLAEEERKESKR